MNETDWERVSEIYRQGIESGIATFTKECPVFAVWDSMHLKSCRFVFEESDMVVGWIAVSPTSTREVYRGVVEISVYVDEQYRGQGIGTALVEHLKERAPRFGFWSLFSVILAVNMSSINIHKKCGFREIGYKERIAKDRFGNWQNTVLMEYRL